MVTLNKIVRAFTREGARGRRFTPDKELARALMNCLLWEDQFYEDGVVIADRIKTLVPQVEPARAAALAIEARQQMKLRHAPLLVVREMARREKHRVLVADTLARVIQRPDEMTELLAIYWADALGPMQQRKRQPVSAQIKKGLARALTKFDAYQLAKYDRDGAVRIRDVLFLVHAKPKDADQAKVWKQLVDGELVSPDTWEVSLSSGKDKRATFERLIAENKLGGLALLRNLRLMQKAEVPRKTIADAIAAMRTDRILPYRFITAARYAPDFEPELESAMLKSIKDYARLPGRTARGSGLWSRDPRTRSLRRGRDIHLQSGRREGSSAPGIRAARCDHRLAAARLDVSRQGRDADRPQGRSPDRLHGRAESRQGLRSQGARLHGECGFVPAWRRTWRVDACGWFL
jgi:hypothetical protein